MFDFAWSEIALIGVVALIAIGPKDMPVALKAVSQVVKKARRMAGEFQTHVDDMMRDADLKDVRDTFNEIRRFDFKGEVEKHVDPDGALRDQLSRNPLSDAVVTPPPAPLLDMEPASPFVTAPPVATASAGAPAFIPPPATAQETAPAFIPPATRRADAPRARY